MMRSLNHEELQVLQKAVLSIYYENIFAYHGYNYGALDRGALMVAQAIQLVSGGLLHYVALADGLPWVGSFLHPVVELDEDLFIDARGLQTTTQLQEAWAPCDPSGSYPAILPMYSSPPHWVCDDHVVRVIAKEIYYQIVLLELHQAAMERATGEGLSSGLELSVGPGMASLTMGMFKDWDHVAGGPPPRHPMDESNPQAACPNNVLSFSPRTPTD